MRIRNYIDDQVEVADEAVPDDDTFAAYEDLDDDYDTDGEDDDDESEAGDESQDVEHDDEGDDTEQGMFDVCCFQMPSLP